jgi:hypothetical protein
MLVRGKPPILIIEKMSELALAVSKISHFFLFAIEIGNDHKILSLTKVSDDQQFVTLS